MKTAEEIYLETLNNKLSKLTHHDCILLAMKIYANQKIDEAADVAEIVQCDTEYNSRTGDRDPVYCVDQQSILNLKDPL